MRTVTLIAAGILVAALAVVWVLTLPATVSASALPAYTPNVDNGRTMFNAGGCASCHATPAGDPDKVDRTRLGGGLALKSPFGTFYVPNISPDPSDGIGEWSEANFVTALWKGTSPRARPLPAFPYTSYQNMALADMRDLFAYLKTLASSYGPDAPARSTFPFNLRRLVGGVEAPLPSRRDLCAHLSQSAQWNRGLPGERARPLRRMSQP